MQFTPEFVQQQRLLENAVTACQRELENTDHKLTKAKAQLTKKQGKMGFRERWLGGWFGGNKRLVEEANKNEVQITELQDARLTTDHQLKLAKDRSRASLVEYVRGADGAFAEAEERFSALVRAKRSVDSFIALVDRALSEVDDAQGMETMDLFTHNSVISVLSYMENDEAQDAINRVRASLPELQQSLAQYDEVVNGVIDSLGGVDVCDNLDLAFDLLLDGFDFMSMFTLAALDDAETELRKLRSKIVEIRGSVNKQYIIADNSREQQLRDAFASFLTQLG